MGNQTSTYFAAQPASGAAVQTPVPFGAAVPARAQAQQSSAAATSNGVLSAVPSVDPTIAFGRNTKSTINSRIYNPNRDVRGAPRGASLPNVQSFAAQSCHHVPLDATAYIQDEEYRQRVLTGAGLNVSYLSQ